MGNPWFETVAVAQRRAEKRLPKSVYGAIVGGSEKGLTFSDNLNAFDELGFAPHIAGLHAGRDQSVTVMGQNMSMPVIISPTGLVVSLTLIVSILDLAFLVSISLNLLHQIATISLLEDLSHS